MADPEHYDLLKRGVEVWNAEREINPGIKPDLSEAYLYAADLRGADLSWVNFKGAKLYEANLSESNLHEAYLYAAHLSEANLSRADLSESNLSRANLYKANFSKTNLSRADLSKANLSRADFRGAKLYEANLSEANLSEVYLSSANLIAADLRRADLRGADLRGAELSWADLEGADLRGADLSEAKLLFASLVTTNLEDANLAGCHIYGIYTWDLDLEGAKQSNLVITGGDQPTITVDNLEVAQFICMLLDRKKLRDILDTITFKSVLILGRFTSERKAVLDVMANELRKYNLIPIVFDLERASSRDFKGTIKVLADMSLFVIADITNPKSAPLELQARVPDYQVPFVPILQKDEKPFSMFSSLGGKYHWVLPLLEYESMAVLVKVFKKAIIDKAIKMRKELLRLKAETVDTEP